MGIQKPAWLEALYREKFFVACPYHETAKKNERNVCCLDCCVSLCPHCVPSHRFHRLLQIRRYVYHDVVRLEDLQKLIDCSNVQAYTINSAKVVFIKKRPQNRQFKGAGNYCTSCDRSLQEPFIHCSLGCKVDFVLKHYKDLSPCLRVCNTLTLGPDYIIPQDYYTYDDDDTPPRSMVLDEPMMSSSSGSDTNHTCATTTLAYTCRTDIVRKKRSPTSTNSGFNYVCSRSATSNYNKVINDQDMATGMSRRKGIPHRSPLC